MEKDNRNNHIDNVCNILANIWKTAPELRFGQIISNLLKIKPKDIFNKNSNYDADEDPFYWNDEKFLDKLKEMFKYEK